MAPRKVEISHRTIFFIALFLLGLALLWRIRSIIVLFFISFVIMEALNPLVTKLEKKGIPRIVAILVLYFLVLLIIGFAIAGIVPILIVQTTALVSILPSLINNISIFDISAIDITSQLRILDTLPQNIALIAFSVFSNIFSTMIILVLAFYLLLERKNFDNYGLALFGPSVNKKSTAILERLELSLGSWVRAEVILMTIIGVLAYIGYWALGLNFALSLAILAGLLEIIPNIGPIVSTGLAAVVGFSISPVTGLLTLLWGMLIQQLENNLIVPKVMKDNIGINPLITILIMISGAELAGVIGAILAVPIYLTVREVFTVLLDDKKPQRNR